MGPDIVTKVSIVVAKTPVMVPKAPVVVAKVPVVVAKANVPLCSMLSQCSLTVGFIVRDLVCTSGSGDPII